MSLPAEIGTLADEIQQSAACLQRDFEDAVLQTHPDSQIRQELIALKIAVSNLKMQSLKLTSLTAAARMTGDLPKERALAPVIALPLFGDAQKTRTPEELMAMFPHHPPPLPGPFPDFKSLAAADDTFRTDPPAE